MGGRQGNVGVRRVVQCRIETLLRDLRVSVRLLLRQPGFAATAILTLALGIGATTMIFSVVDASCFDRSHSATPDRIVAVTSF